MPWGQISLVAWFPKADCCAERRRSPRPALLRRYSGQVTFVLDHAQENKLDLAKGRHDFFVSSNGDTDMSNSHGRFVWYELVTTDMKTAKHFYANVVGWGARDVSAPGLGYSLFTVADLPVAGFMNMPEDGQKTGAAPRWIGYVRVDDVDSVVDRVKQLGGAASAAFPSSPIRKWRRLLWSKG
jgi:predicted enzyme related to lactoylglutathione lyase